MLKVKTIDSQVARQIIVDRGCTCDPAKSGTVQPCKEHSPWAWKQAQKSLGC